MYYKPTSCEKNDETRTLNMSYIFKDDIIKYMENDYES